MTLPSASLTMWSVLRPLRVATSSVAMSHSTVVKRTTSSLSYMPMALWSSVSMSKMLTRLTPCYVHGVTTQMSVCLTARTGHCSIGCLRGYSTPQLTAIPSSLAFGYSRCSLCALRLQRARCLSISHSRTCTTTGR